MTEENENIEPTELDKLAAEVSVAKQAEGIATEKRIAAEEKLLLCSQIELKGSGSKTYSSNYYKVKINEPVSVKLDEEVYGELVERGLKMGDFSPIVSKLEINKKKLGELAKFKPEMFKELSRCLTEKQGKISVGVELLKVKEKK